MNMNERSMMLVTSLKTKLVRKKCKYSKRNKDNTQK